jgi:amino acid transporter
MAEEYRKNYWFIDLLSAIACGYLIGAFQQHTANSGQDIPGNFVRCVLLAIGSYSVMALLLPALKSRPLRRIPNWILIVVLGSIVFYFCIHLVDTVTYAWRFRYTQPELSLARYILSYIWEFGIGLFFVTIIDSILALPIMAAVHYLGSWLMQMLGGKKSHAA